MNKKDIIEYCLTFPESYVDYPFDDNWSTVRHRVNKKSFAFIYEYTGKLCVNLKCDPLRSDILRQIYNDVTPGYHMNKQYWNTVIIGGDVPESELYEMIHHSYDLVKPKLKRNKQYRTLPDSNTSWLEDLYRAVFGDDYGKIPDNAEESVDYVLNMLPQREKMVILARFKDKKTCTVIGKECGVSGNRVYQIEGKAKRKLRNPKRSRYLRNLSEEIKNDEIAKEEAEEERRSLLIKIKNEQSIEALEHISIIELNLSVRSYNCLKRAGITTLADLTKLTSYELMNIRYLGVRSYNEILTACEKYGAIIM